MVHQEYIYTDETMNPGDPNAYVVLRGPIDIDRAILALDTNWIYDIIKFDAPEGSSVLYQEARKTLGPVGP